MASETQNLPTLDTLRDGQSDRPAHGRDLGLVTQGRLRVGDGQVVSQVGTVPDKTGVLLDVDQHHDIPALPSPRADVAFATQRNEVLGRHAGGNFDLDGPLGAGPSFTMTPGATSA